MSFFSKIRKPTSGIAESDHHHHHHHHNNGLSADEKSHGPASMGRPLPAIPASNGHNHHAPQPPPLSRHSSSNNAQAAAQAAAAQAKQPKLVFHCQQAHGSPTGLISGFTNVKELYEKIAECYDIQASEILFCTLNTHKVDMNKLLGGQIGLDDFIFAHRKGRAKEIEITKSEDALGLTITDNGAGYAFIKRIKEGSIIDRIKYINIGDHIERIDETSLIGCRHYEVAKMLKEIPKGTTFVMRLVEPLQAGFSYIGPKTNPGSGKKSFGSGKETLRLRANGPARVEEAPDSMVEAAVEKINSLLESFLGINDTDLAIQIWEMGEGKTNTMDFAEAIDNSDLEAFGFTDDFIFELWGAITDAKAGRLRKQSKDMHF